MLEYGNAFANSEKSTVVKYSEENIFDLFQNRTQLLANLYSQKKYFLTIKEFNTVYKINRSIAQSLKLQFLDLLVKNKM